MVSLGYDQYSGQAYQDFRSTILPEEILWVSDGENDYYNIIMRGNNKSYVFNKGDYKQYSMDYLDLIETENP